MDSRFGPFGASVSSAKLRCPLYTHGSDIILLFTVFYWVSAKYYVRSLSFSIRHFKRIYTHPWVSKAYSEQPLFSGSCSWCWRVSWTGMGFALNLAWRVKEWDLARNNRWRMRRLRRMWVWWDPNLKRNRCPINHRIKGINNEKMVSKIGNTDHRYAFSPLKRKTWKRHSLALW